MGARIKDIRNRAIPRIGHFLQKVGQKLSTYRQQSITGIWIDVGAHLGEKTYPVAAENPSLLVYAFEPNLRLAAQRFGLLPNFIMIPMAVSEKEGCHDFYINSFDAASSLLPFEPEGLKSWINNEVLRVKEKVSVPVIRLDTFMNYLSINQVDWLKIDAQGNDLSVVKSSGDKIRNIRKITLEVSLTQIPLYSGAATKDEIIEYLENSNFTLTESEFQSSGQEQNLTFVQRP